MVRASAVWNLRRYPSYANNSMALSDLWIQHQTSTYTVSAILDLHLMIRTRHALMHRIVCRSIDQHLLVPENTFDLYITKLRYAQPNSHTGKIQKKKEYSKYQAPASETRGLSNSASLVDAKRAAAPVSVAMWALFSLCSVPLLRSLQAAACLSLDHLAIGHGLLDRASYHIVVCNVQYICLIDLSLDLWCFAFVHQSERPGIFASYSGLLDRHD